MKIAVLSDIHGNMDALSAVLEDVKEQGCNKMYCLGDYAMAGPEPDKTISKIIELRNEYDMTLIQGNTDLMIAEYSEERCNSLKTTAPVMAEALKDDVRIISSDKIEFLKQLPEKIQTEEDGIKILLVHGSPRKNNENILPDTPLEEVEQMLEGVDATLILCGHTHIPCGFQTSKGQTVINVGSVGRPFTEKPKACYLVLTISDGKYLIEHRFVKYDNEAASRKILERTFEGKEKLAETLIHPSERHF